MGLNETTEDVVGALRGYLLEELVDPEEVPHIDADENLLTSGLLDSTGAVRLAMHVEELYGIEVGPNEFTIENFRSLGALAAFVRARRAENAS